MELDIPVTITNDLERKIAESFTMFDHIGNKTIDARDVGLILRFLGCAPTELEIKKIMKVTEFEDNKGVIHLGRFLPHVCQLLTERKMEPSPAEGLLEAFEVLDPDSIGYLTKEFMAKVMTEEGEPLTKEELDEMMAVAVDPQTGYISYEYYLNQLSFEPRFSIYDLAAKLEAERIAALPPPKTPTDYSKFTSQF